MKANKFFRLVCQKEKKNTNNVQNRHNYTRISLYCKISLKTISTPTRISFNPSPSRKRPQLSNKESKRRLETFHSVEMVRLIEEIELIVILCKVKKKLIVYIYVKMSMDNGIKIEAQSTTLKGRLTFYIYKENIYPESMIFASG